MIGTQTLFAEEVLYEACQIVTHLWRENRASEPCEAQMSVEASAIVRSLRACAEQGLWTERMADISQDAWSDLMQKARIFALEHHDVDSDPKALAALVGAFAVFFRDRMCATDAAAQVIPKAALHITMAVLSRMRQMQEVEAVRWAAAVGEQNGIDAEACRAIDASVVAWSSCEDEAVSCRRLMRCGLDADLAWVKRQCGKLAPVYYACLRPELQHDSEWIRDIRVAASDETTPKQRLEAWFCASLKFPMIDQCALSARMRDGAYDVWMSRMVALPDFQDCSCDKLGTRMEAMALLENALVWLLTGQYAEMDTANTRCVPADLMPIWHVLRALASLRQDLPWEDAFLRQPLCMPPTWALWPHFRSLYFALRALALCRKDVPQVALEELQVALSCDVCDARVCLVLAHAHTRMSHFGEAQLWIRRADEADVAGVFEAMRDGARAMLAQKALETAKASPLKDDSLLELAMTLGRGEVFTDAFLCWFDAGFEQFRWLAEALLSHPEERAAVVRLLLAREDVVRLDALYRLASELDLHGQDDEAHRDASILMGLACSDRPEDAFWHLGRVMESWPHASRVAHEKHFWCVASKYIEFGVPMLAIDDMTRNLALDFARDTALSRHVFRIYLAHLPRTALMPVQQILIETLGREKAVACLMRLKQAEPEAVVEVSETHFSLPLPEIMGASLSWQMLALAGNKLRPQVSAVSPSKREIARTLMTRSREIMPEPPKAAWIHTKQGKASDAFDTH